MLSLDMDSGNLYLNAYVNNNMHGYMFVQIEAIDLAGNKDMAFVKIYIVSENNRVKFIFLSDIEALRRNEKFVSKISHKHTNYGRK